MKPMLAAVAELDKITFPVITSPKLDGIRCLVDPFDGPVSRTGKPIPNRFIRETLASAGLDGLDGEIITYRRGKPQRFEDVSSAVMSRDGEPAFAFHVFDTFTRPDKPYEHRLWDLMSDTRFSRHSGFLALVPTAEAYSAKELLEQHRANVKAGYEGTMLRVPEGPYKFGRSTVNEGYLSKLKDYRDDEATIVNCIERLNHKPSLGAISVEWRGRKFEIGSGFTEKQRTDLWNARWNIIGKQVKFKFQELTSSGMPRFPVFLGMRHGFDMVT